METVVGNPGPCCLYCAFLANCALIFSNFWVATTPTALFGEEEEEGNLVPRFVLFPVFYDDFLFKYLLLTARGDNTCSGPSSLSNIFFMRASASCSALELEEEARRKRAGCLNEVEVVLVEVEEE